MRTINIAQPEATLLALMNQARQEEIMVQLADGQAFIITAIDSVDDEIVRTRNNVALMALLDERTQEPPTIDLATLKADLGIT